MPQDRLDNALEQLVRAERIYRRGAPPDADYTFKHALPRSADRLCVRPARDTRRLQ